MSICMPVRSSVSHETFPVTILFGCIGILKKNISIYKKYTLHVFDHYDFFQIYNLDFKLFRIIYQLAAEGTVEKY